MSINEIMAKIVKASIEAPPGYVSRRDIEMSTGCSEATAIRAIRKMQRSPGFKKITVKIDGKNVHYYKCD